MTDSAFDQDDVTIAMMMVEAHHGNRNNPRFYSEVVMFGPTSILHVLFKSKGKKHSVTCKTMNEAELRSRYVSLPVRNDLHSILLLVAADAPEHASVDLFMVLNKMAPSKYLGLQSMFTPATFDALRTEMATLGVNR